MAELIPSAYQQAVYDFIQNPLKGSAVAIAVAGSGKTTTILEALKLIPPSQSVQLYAFNKAIADTLRKAIGYAARNVYASTFHSSGYQALCRHFGLKQLETNSGKLRLLCRERIPDFHTRLRYESFICRLVDLAKGVGIGVLVDDTFDAWQEIVDHHDLYLDDPQAKEVVGIQLARNLFEWSLEAALENYQIDFADQLYLPVLWDLPLDPKDWVFVDEAQDTNAIRREIIAKTLKPGTGRLIAVGDPKQAIYGFTGASTDAIDLIRDRWECTELPLSVSYRCPLAVVRKAQELVPYIEAAPGAPEGAVSRLTLSEAIPVLGPTDAILCRNNAPLVDLAYTLLRKGVACQILGRDIGKGLMGLVDRMKARDLEHLEVLLAEYRTREVQKLLERNQHAKAQAVDDRVQCLFTFIDNLPESERTLNALRASLDKLFGDETAGKLTLSTVHKAKGGQWDQVCILRPDLMPAPWAKEGWETEQENHLQYVAWTRAKARLIFLPEGGEES